MDEAQKEDIATLYRISRTSRQILFDNSREKGEIPYNYARWRTFDAERRTRRDVRAARSRAKDNL